MRRIRQFFAHHPWWGRLLGLFFGYLIAGASGALFGLLVGNFFDRGLHRHFNPTYWQYQSIKDPSIKQLFFKATFWVLGYMAKADGKVSSIEIQATTDLMEEFGLTRRQKKAAQQLFSEGKSMEPAANPMQGILNHLRTRCESYNPQLLHFFLDLQYRTAKKDNFALQKKLALDKILKQLGFAPLHFQTQFNGDFIFRERRQSSDPSSSEKPPYSQRSRAGESSHTYSREPAAYRPFQFDAYGILGVPNTATQQEVKRAYRRLISQHHPDKLIARGASESLIKAANERTQQIRKAYEQICASRGWP